MRENFNDLFAFLEVAREGSFTRAAAKLGVSQSALSHTVRGLEERLGVRLLTRTTRSVSSTEAGERLLNNVAPRYDEIQAELAGLTELQDKPAGSFRITTAEHAANSVLWPRLQPLLAEHPEIRVELTIDYGLTDIVTQRFDAGVRLGEQVEKDMIAVRIGPEMRMAVVATPAYFRDHAIPRTPRDLSHHNCINLRLPTYGSLLNWEFERQGQVLNAHVEGQLTFNSSSAINRAALAGFGLAYVPEDLAREAIEDGRLIRVLEGWCPSFPGYHLYYPHRRQASSAFSLMVEALRYRDH